MYTYVYLYKYIYIYIFICIYHGVKNLLPICHSPHDMVTFDQMTPMEEWKNANKMEEYMCVLICIYLYVFYIYTTYIISSIYFIYIYYIYNICYILYILMYIFKDMI